MVVIPSSNGDLADSPALSLFEPEIGSAGRMLAEKFELSDTVGVGHQTALGHVGGGLA